jgi:membrane-bound lytic murein transglycosylase D
MLNKKVICLVVFLGLANGCMTTRPIAKPTNVKSQFNPSVQVEDLSEKQESSLDPVSDEAEDTETASQEEEQGNTVSNNDLPDELGKAPPLQAQSNLEAIPIEMNEHVEKWIKYFSEKDRARFQRFLNQGTQYREVVENLLEENGIPPHLYYLAMIESGYYTRATSIAKAVGVWQFIPATGKRYGLEVNPYNDERRDPIRATEAAAKYLKDLYNVFGSWYLAIAAYNAGEFRIMTSVIRGKSRDFWTLVKMRVLPSETANYIPKFLAAITIGENPEQYGFEPPQAEKYPDLDSVEVPSPIRLADLARVIQVPLADLQRINPNLRKNMTPPYAKNYEVWLPTEKAKEFNKVQAQLANLRIVRPRLAIPVVSEQPRHYHTVRSGETLTLIAQKYKLSIKYLRNLNQLSSNRLIAGTRLRVTAKSYHPHAVTRYYVRRGDNLNQIAKRFKVSVRKLKDMNSIRGNTITVGQVLRIQPTRVN